MELCDNCVFYCPKFNALRQDFDDTIVDNPKETERKYCPLYDDYISPDFINGKNECKFYEKTN